MDCKKTQRLMMELAGGRLPEAAAREVQQHMGECTDCRVAQQRARQLQQLLAIKRYETPGPQYFENFIGAFHDRLARETAPRPTLWRQFCEQLHIQPILTMRYSFAHALAVAFAVALVWRGISSTELPASLDQQTHLDFSPPRLVSSVLPAPHSTPRMIASALPTRSTDSAAAGGFLMMPALGDRAAFDAPRYVLDHITVSPASYEVASIHF